MPSKKVERLNLSIDQTLKRQFDAICALKGLSMSDIAQEVIKKWVLENAPPGLLEEARREIDSTDEPPKNSSKRRAK
jgi:antitoxin component of RelBE/YafQ-DinJ toxin-antitoxin module